MCGLTKKQLDYLENKAKDQRKTDRQYHRCFKKLEAATTWREKFAIVGEEFLEVEGRNNWHESAIKDEFGVEVLPELQQFYAQSIDGLDHVIYSFDEVMRTNKELRESKEIKELYLPFGHFLFIGGAGNGDLYGLAYNASGSMNDLIWFWNHETDSRIEYCCSLNQLIASHFTYFEGFHPGYFHL